MTELKGMKFRVKDAIHSRLVQEKLFSMGYEWSSSGDMPSHLEQPFLFAYECGKLTHGNTDWTFNQSELEEHVMVTDTVFREVSRLFVVDGVPMTLQEAKDYINAQVEK